MTTPLFYAGQEQLTAAELNAAFPLTSFADADTSRTSSTTFLDADGLVVELEANSQYAIDGWISYVAGATGDLKVQLLVPTGAGGSWGMYALSTTSTGSVGTVQANRAPVGAGNALTAGGSASFSGAMNALLRGYIATGDTPGELQLQFAQNTSNATATTIKEGSWIRAQKISGEPGFVGEEQAAPVSSGGGGGGGSRPYFDTADWHWDPIPASPTLDSQSANIVNLLKNEQHVLNVIEYGNTLRGPDGIDGSTPRYTVAAAEAGSWGPAFPGGATIPIPDGTEDHLATGGDKHLAIADPIDNRVYSLWIANKSGGTWSCDWGGTAALDGDGRESIGGSTGCGISRYACVIREAELVAGEIPHALFFSTDMAREDTFKYPATKTDGSNDGGQAYTIWEGARVQLNPSLDPDSYSLTTAERAIFVALQVYGAYCGDNGGARMAFLSELSPTRAGADPGDGYESVGIDGDYYDLSAIPWNQLRVLRNWDGSA